MLRCSYKHTVDLSDTTPHPDIFDSSTAIPTAVDIIPQDLKLAYQKGDYAAIQRFRDQNGKDMKGIYHNLEKNGDNAWVQTTDPHTQRPLFICITGQPNQPDGWMWVYALEDITNSAVHAMSDSGNTGFINTIQIGTLSRNTKMLGVSMTMWDNTILNTTIAGATSAVAWFWGHYVSDILKKIPTPAALSNAFARVAARLPSVGVAANRIGTWLAAYPKSIKVFRAGLIGLIITFLFQYLADFVYRTYRISINIYNWSSRNFVVDSFFGSNEKLSGDDDFLPGAIPAASVAAGIPLPGGMSGVASGTAVSYASYVYENVNKVLEGVGVGLQVSPAEGGTDGLRLKYNLRRFKKNQIGIDGSSPTSPSLKDWYNDGSKWASTGSKQVTSKLADNTPIMGTTPDLSGRDDQLYEFDVHIGIDKLPNAAVMAMIEAEEEVEEVDADPTDPGPLDDPPAVGDKVALFDEGQYVTVVDSAQVQ